MRNWVEHGRTNAFKQQFKPNRKAVQRSRCKMNPVPGVLASGVRLRHKTSNFGRWNLDHQHSWEMSLRKPRSWEVCSKTSACTEARAAQLWSLVGDFKERPSEKNHEFPPVFIFCHYIIHFQTIWRFPIHGGTPSDPFYLRIFHEINHPAIGDFPFMETPYYHQVLTLSINHLINH